MAKEDFQTGTVIKSTGSWYEIQTLEEIIAAKVRGKFRLQDQVETNPIAVGDRVQFRKEADGTGLITERLPRQSKLSRRAAGRKASIEHVIVANVDKAWCVQSFKTPRFNAGFVDRFLVMAEIEGLEAGIVINKADLSDPDLDAEIGFWEALYTDIGYPVFKTSAATGQGLDDLRNAFKDQINVVSGPSGVGKSSLLNTLEPRLGLRTGEVSERTNKGKHTTTHATLLPLSFGGYVADTPGLREFGIYDLAASDLSGFFVEFRPYLDDCRYPNCTHDHEPQCAVKAAVTEEALSQERYNSYLNILYTLHLGQKDVGR